MHVVFVLHGEGEVPGANGAADVGSRQEGVEEENRAARQGVGLRAVLQRQRRKRRGGPVRTVHVALRGTRLNRSFCFATPDRSRKYTRENRLSKTALNV